MISLRHSEVAAQIDPLGAWVETLTAHSEAILFPKSELQNDAGDVKTRGGMHVCLPNFGPGGESGLAQHGFGRTSTWSVLQQQESSVILELIVPDGTYKNLVARLQYTLEHDSLNARLSLTNNSPKPYRVAPGFHPYFVHDISSTTAVVNEETFRLDQLADAVYRNSNSAKIALAKQHIDITTENLSTLAIWTDQLGNYVCAEPTFGGNRFLEPEQPDEQLNPGETKVYSTRISW